MADAKEVFDWEDFTDVEEEVEISVETTRELPVYSETIDVEEIASLKESFESNSPIDKTFTDKLDVT